MVPPRGKNTLAESGWFRRILLPREDLVRGEARVGVGRKAQNEGISLSTTRRTVMPSAAWVEMMLCCFVGLEVPDEVGGQGESLILA
jgi:hypothetical protein